MALLTERAGLIADGVLRARDWDPASYTLTGATRELFGQAATDALRVAWGFQKWDVLMRVEARRYRPDWAEDVAYEADAEVWHDGTGAYWRAVSAQTGNEPAEGSTYWEKPDDFIPFIQLAQPWEAWQIDEAGVDLGAFAWASDPRQHPGMRAIQGLSFWMDSVVLPQGSPDLVWVRYMPRAPELGFTEYAAGTTYEAGELAYVTATGRCYSALQEATGKDPATETAYWTEVGVPKFMSRYVRQYVLSQWLTVAEGRYEAEGRAKAMLEDMGRQMFERAGCSGGARASVGVRR